MQQDLHSVEELRSRMKYAPRISLDRNTFYRDCPVAAYAIYGTGPLHGLTAGARYSPPGKFPVIYLSADRLLAQTEAAHHLIKSLPTDQSEKIRTIHQSLTSMDVAELLAILRDMANSDEGYEDTGPIQKYLNVPLVKEVFDEDPARLQVFLEMCPNLQTPLRCIPDTTRICISIDVSARGILDLTNKKTLSALQIDQADLLRPTEEWQSASAENPCLTQRIGLAAWDAPEIDGLLVPTALPIQSISSLITIKKNLVLFMNETDKHKPRSTKVSLDTEEEFVKLTKLFWTHRPDWLLEALDKHEPAAAKVLRRIGS